MKGALLLQNSVRVSVLGWLLVVEGPVHGGVREYPVT